MPEKEYRASRTAKVLGNPTVYQIMKTLSPKNKKNSTDIAKQLGLSIPNVSKTLRVLRLAEFVRYETAGNEKQYWIKDQQIVGVMRELERFVEKTKRKTF